MRALTAISLLALSGCTTIEPNSIHLGVEHLSSLTQHFSGGNVGLEAAMVSAQWKPTPHTFVEVQENYILGRMVFTGNGGKEFFEARAGLNLELKK